MTVLGRTDGSDLRFPVTQYVRFDPGEFGNFTDLEVKLVGDLQIHAPNQTKPAVG
jgi:hypothetical protein